MLFRAYQSHMVICFAVFLCVYLTAYPSFNKEVMCFSTRVTNADNFIVFFYFSLVPLFRVGFFVRSLPNGS